MPYRRLRTFAVLCAGFLGGGCARAEVQDYSARIPGTGDWIDCGTVLSSGSQGEWDRYLWGGFAASVLKKDGRYFLYYQGSDDYHEGEGTVMHRAIGVATSADGFRFSKYSGNPVLTFSPNSHHEEGAVSTAAILDDANRVGMYYGANAWAGSDLVNADARFAMSPDGFAFEDHGVVLDHRDGAVWGHGDELFPIVAFNHGLRRVVYYVPNGTLQRGQLGVAWADGTGAYHSSRARTGLRGIQVWGAGSAARVGPNLYALFLTQTRGAAYMEIRTVTPERPDRLSAAVRRYTWDGVVPVGVMLDDDRWLLYYRDANHERYGVMVASASLLPSRTATPRCRG